MTKRHTLINWRSMIPAGKPSLILSIMMLIVLSGCSLQTIREAQNVVAQADTLWHNGQMYGIDEGDSARLAQACETLSAFNSPLLSTFNSQLSTDYAHACYHYGRLLRAKDDPVAAMQLLVFY